MKKHAIIPIFIPHLGCLNDCVFCNQKIITARSTAPDISSVSSRIEEYLLTLQDRDLETIEVAFFGGSFTGLPHEEQNAYLDVARRFKSSGDIHKIRLSTRPDYIDERILTNLKSHDVDIIELGVQSFDPDVLHQSKRGHTVEDVYEACHLIQREYDFELGIQLMVGLPGDSSEKSIDSARKAAALSPTYARLYPTVILEDTQLAEMHNKGDFSPLSESMMRRTVGQMYKILSGAGITILRVGLKSTDLVTSGSDLGGGYHPAFRQLVEGDIAKEQMEGVLQDGSKQFDTITFSANERWFSPMIGHKGCNKKALEEEYPRVTIRYQMDPNLPDGVISGNH